MLIIFRFLLCFLILFSFLGSETGNSGHFASAKPTSVRQQELLKGTLLAINKVTSFFAREYRNFNINGVFGLQALDGILQDLLTKGRGNRIHLPHDLLYLLTELHKKATLIARKAQPFLNASEPDYYRKLGFLASHAWLFKREFRSLDTSLSQGSHFIHGALFHGVIMDQCISDLIGNSWSGARPCNITNECWRFVRRKNTQGYMTTHQALYFMLGEVKGCLPAIKRRLFRTHRNRTDILEDVFEALCARIYHEVRWKEAVLENKQRSRNTTEEDLYMEQCYVCGILGYHKFLSLDRLSTVLGWQLPPGCYGKNARDKDEAIKVDGNNGEDTFQRLVKDVRGSNPSVGTSRRQTNNNLPGDLSSLSTSQGNCETHTTGVATGLLGVYLKWLLTFPSLEFVLM